MPNVRLSLEKGEAKAKEEARKPICPGRDKTEASLRDLLMCWVNDTARYGGLDNDMSPEQLAEARQA